MTRTLLTISLLAALAGCADSTIQSEGVPLDEEFGTIDWGKSDNSVIRPGSAEAIAVLAYANQPIASDAEGQQFLTELDTELHRWAAENIVSIRAGSDGTFATADDRTFADLAELDRVPWVGRATLMQMFVLADANGYFSQNIRCNDVVTSPITTLAQLVEIENSGCDYFDGDLRIGVDGMVLPSHRTLKALDNVRYVTGALILNESPALDKLVFRGLREVGKIHTSSWMPGLQRVELPALEMVHNLRIDSRKPFRFDALREVGKMWADEPQQSFPSLEDGDEIMITARRFDGLNALKTSNALTLDVMEGVRGLAALETAGRVRIESSSNINPLEVDGLGSLKRVEALTIQARNVLATAPSVTLTSLPSLERAELLDFTSNNVVFDALTSVGSIQMGTFGGMFPVLETALYINIFATGYPFPVLREIEYDGRIAGTGPSRPSVLERVGGHFKISPLVSTYDQLHTVGRDLEINVEVAGDWDGLNALQSAGTVSVESWNHNISGLRGLVDVEGRVTVELHGNVRRFDALPNLRTSGGITWTNRARSTTLDVLSSLTHVDGSAIFDAEDSDDRWRQPKAVTGLNALETIEGDVLIQTGNAMDGLRSVRSIGGQRLGFPRMMQTAERDELLSQLQQFSGQIITL